MTKNLSNEQSALLFLSEHTDNAVHHQIKVEEYLTIRKYFLNFEECKYMRLHECNYNKLTHYHQLITATGSDGVNVWHAGSCMFPPVVVDRDKAEIWDTRGVANQRDISKAMQSLRDLGYTNISLVNPYYLRRKYSVYCYGRDLPQVWARQDANSHTANIKDAGEFYLTKDAEDYLHKTFKDVAHEIGFV